MSHSSLSSVEQQALQLPPDEQLSLMEKLARNLREKSKRKPPKDLCGIWKDKFPEDFDIDQALKEIRSEWLKEMDEL